MPESSGSPLLPSNLSSQSNKTINFKVKYRELFPNTISVIVFLVYITLFVNHGLLTHATQNSKTGSYDYDPTIIVLLTETLKLIICSLLIIKDKNIKEAANQLLQNTALLALYLIPSGLYTLD